MTTEGAGKRDTLTQDQKFLESSLCSWASVTDMILDQPSNVGLDVLDREEKLLRQRHVTWRTKYVSILRIIET